MIRKDYFLRIFCECMKFLALAPIKRHPSFSYCIVPNNDVQSLDKNVHLGYSEKALMSM